MGHHHISKADQGGQSTWCSPTLLVGSHIFSGQQLLHFGHKVFNDHPMKRCKEALGAYVLDEHYKAQHCSIDIFHFSNGVSHIKQMTRCEHYELQQTIVPMIAHANATVLPQFVYYICSLVEFIYRAWYDQW